MRKSGFVSILGALAAVAAQAQTPTAPATSAATTPAAKTVLRINGVGISAAEFNFARRGFMPPSTQTRSADEAQRKAEDQQAVRKALAQVIDRALLVQAARDAKIVVDAKTVEDGLAAQRQQAGPERFNQAMAGAGLTEQDLTRMETDQLLFQSFIKQEIVSKVAVSDAESKAYYDQHPEEFKHPEEVKLAMIFVAVPPGADQAAQSAAKAKADAAHKRLVDGADFAEVAKDTSDHPSKAGGGEVGWVRQGQLPVLEPTFWNLKPGEFSPVAQNQYGYQIFKLEDRRAAGTLSYDEVKQRLTSLLRARATDDAVQKVIMDRREKAKIEILDPMIKAALDAQAPAGAPVAKPATGAPPAAAKPAGDAPKPH